MTSALPHRSTQARCILVLVACVIAGRRRRGRIGRHPGAHSQRSGAACGHRGGQVAMQASTQPDRATAAPPVHDVLFVGASYTAGLGAYAPDRRLRLPDRPRARLADPGQRRLGHRLPQSRPARRPDASPTASRTCRPARIRIWWSSRAGATTSATRRRKLRAAAIETADLTRKRFAGAQIVFLGPIPGPRAGPGDQIAVAETLRSAAARCKAIFVNPIEQGWITPGNESGYIGPCAGAPRQRGLRLHRRSGCSADLEGLYPNHGNA